MKFTFDEFRKILSDEGLNPSIGILNKVWAGIQHKLNPPITRSSIDDCVEVWAETLKRFKAQRPILPAEKAAIGRAIMANENDPEPVKLALYGARFEQGSDKFNPAQHLSVHRVLDPKNFARFASIGAQERGKRQPSQPSPAAQSEVYQAPQEQETVDPEKVPMTPEARQLLASLGMVKPVAPSEEDMEKRRLLLRRQAEMIAREGGNQT